MRKILRWGGLALAIGGYLALTIWSNTSAGESALSRGEAATRSGMRPFWILIYFGIAILVASWFGPRKEQSHNGDTTNKATTAIQPRMRLGLHQSLRLAPTDHIRSYPRTSGREQSSMSGTRHEAETSGRGKRRIRRRGALRSSDLQLVRLGSSDSAPVNGAGAI